MKKRKIKRKVKLLLIVIFITFLIICSIDSNNKGQVIKVEQLNNYKYILVNKKNKLNKDFKPNNLVDVKKCSEGNFYLEEETAEAYQQMCLDTIKAGLNISITSAYRSYNEQIKLYNEYLKLYGKDYVDKYVAVAGYSEHQTGLAIDLKSLDYENFKYSKEYLWVKENSHNYGFIVRYPDGKEKITGYNAEEWHIRYVGKEAAKYIYENDITFEEYYNLFLK